jgi:Fic family protein
VDISKFIAPEMGRLEPIVGVNYRRNEEYNHFAFVPAPLPYEVKLENRTHTIVAKASMEVGRLQECVKRLPVPGVLLRPSIAREAKSTSALEGTYAPLQEILEGDYLEESQLSNSVKEIRNYMKTADRGLELIKSKPIYITLLSELQGMLVDGTLGAYANQGEVRTGLVIIGDETRPVNEARFIPPPAGEILLTGYYEWEKWINAVNDISPIIKMALGHYQFETLHPYSDGNGRLGRLIISLQFVEHGFLNPPVLNLSDWLNREKEKYKDELLVLSYEGDFDRWIGYFADSIIGQAQREITRIEELLGFRNKLVETLNTSKERGVVLKLADYLIGNPVLSVKRIAEEYRVTYPPASSAVNKLVKLGVLREITGRKYRRIYVCMEVIRILEK